MHIGAIICEYNPFHNGHFHQIKELRAKKGGAVLALMSGNFVQRGEMSFFDKFTRTRAALLGGADLVLELPLPFSLQSAEGFASGAVKTLQALGCVDTLCFGATCTDVATLTEIAALLRLESTTAKVKLLKKEGVPYPVALQKIVGDTLGDEKGEVLGEANNILALEYTKALLALQSNIRLLPIPRKGVLHSEESNGTFASATHLRTLLAPKHSTWQQFVPEDIAPLYEAALAEGNYWDSQRFALVALGYLKRLTASDFFLVEDVTGGFENKIAAQVSRSTSYTQLVDSLVDKTHTRALVKRVLVNALLGLPKVFSPNFVRVLGFNQLGAQVLGKLKQTATIPFSDKILDCGDREYQALLDRSTNLYNLCLHKPRESKTEFTTPVVKL